MLIKKKRNKFTQISDKIILDTNISHGAYRIYSYLYSKPDNWEYFRSDVMKKLKLNKNNHATFLNELLENNWIERKRNTKTNGYDYILNDDNSPEQNIGRYEDIEKQTRPTPQALYLVCQDLLNGFEFSMPLTRLDNTLDPNTHLHIRMSEEGYFWDLAEEIGFDEKKSKATWLYLWQDRFNEVMTFIKEKRR